MQESGRVEWLSRGAKELGVLIKFNYSVMIDDERCAVAIAYFPDFGGKKGILIFTEYDEIKPFWRDIIEKGFGFSVLDEVHNLKRFNLDAFRSMLLDWGWSGKKEVKPSWIP